MARRRLPRFWPPVVAGALALASIACDGVSARSIGESAHFHLFLGDGYDLHTVLGGSGDDVLAQLESNWTDTGTLLHMPDSGKIDYYLLLPNQISAKCTPEAAGCELDRSVYSTHSPDQHELNHAYMELLSSHRPAALLVEGVADAIGCDDGGAPPPSFNNVPDWRSIVNYSSFPEVYAPGREFTRYLILTSGPEQFLRYYQQAPNTRDPNVFAANFAAFWSTDIDTVWAAMQVAQPPWGPSEVFPICPCSLAPWTGTSTPTAISGTPSHGYWTWPALNGDTAAWAGYRGSIAIKDCQRQQLSLPADSSIILSRLDGPLYATVSSGTIERGPYVSDVCTDAAPFALPRDLISVTGDTPVSIAVSRTPGSVASVYVALEAPVPLKLASYYWTSGTVSVCPGCDFTATGCQTLPSQPGYIPVTGRFYLQWDPALSTWPYAYTSLLVSLM